MSRIRFAILLGLVAAIALSAATAEASFPGKNGKLAFRRHEVPVGQMFTMNPDGSGLMPIPGTPASSPSWSPDGQKIAYSAHDNPPPRVALNFDVYVVNADGSGRRRVTTDPLEETQPSWSPDGRRLLFVKYLPADGYRVCEITLEGTDERCLTSTRSPSRPVWSPDGTRIAFTAYPPNGGYLHLWVMNGDGDGERDITPPDVSAAEFPDWSPDSSKLTFSTYDDFYGEVYVMNSDGTGARNLTHSPESDVDPAWSPDGTKIVFNTRRFPSASEVMIMNADGSSQTRLTFDNVFDWNPNWQPIPGPKRSDYKNSAQFCKAERDFWGDQFAGRYGGGANAYGKCVSQSH